jgi:sugar O-acyltransferase (sialic acid O-acetyltransferase NeuD family)
LRVRPKYLTLAAGATAEVAVDGVVIFGAGQIAEVVHYYLSHDSGHRVAAFSVDAEYVRESTACGLPVVPFEEVERQFPPAKFGIFVAISFRKVNQLRTEKLAAAEARGYAAISYVSTKSSVWSGFKAEPNTFIMEHNTIQPLVRIGRNTIVWSGNHIGHHATIGDNCFIASHAVISGAVEIGDFSFIGVNATIRDNVKVGRSCVIGAGALILNDAQDYEVYMGQATEVSRVPSNRLRNI